MGFQKAELTTSITSEEKVSTEIIEKENEETKSDKVESTEVLPVIADSGEVCISFYTNKHLNFNIYEPCFFIIVSVFDTGT